MSQVASLLARISALEGAASAPGSGSTVVAGSGVVNVNGYEVRQTISAPGVGGSMVASVSVGKHQDGDENSEELLDVSCITGTAGSGSIEVYMAFLTATSGPVRINYLAT